jgi:quinol monooxygenase YgiN
VRRAVPVRPGTLQYETYFNDDESEAMVLERYRDSQALIDHGQNMAHLMEPIIATATVTLLDEPSPNLPALISGGVPQLFPPRFMAL